MYICYIDLHKRLENIIPNKVEKVKKVKIPLILIGYKKEHEYELKILVSIFDKLEEVL